MIILIKNIINIFFSIVIFPITFFIICLKPIILIRFGNLEYKRIGHLALDTAIYLAKKKHNQKKHNQKKVIDFIGYSNINSSNTELIKIWKKSIKIYNLSFFFNILIISLKFILRSDEHHIKLYNLENESYLLENKNLISFNDFDINKIKNLFFLLNIPFKAKWVCIHNRDNSYIQKSFKYISKQKINETNHRNFSIKDLKEAAQYLSNLGYYVIRVGNIQESRINYSSERIIDYSYSIHKNKLLDIYFLSNCEFYLGSDSGIGNISVIANKYVGLINLTFWVNLQRQNFKRIVIFKKFFSRNLNRFLSLNEIFTNNFHCLTEFSEFKRLNIELINNTQEEIRHLSIELTDKIKGVSEISHEDKKYHIKFWNIIKKYGLNERNNYKDINVSNFYLKNNLYLID